MSSVCARPVGFAGGVKCQRRARVRVSAVAAAAAAAERAAPTTMYEVLAVGEGAGPEEIKAAYRRAARRWHPDACPGGAVRFMRAREAYEVLSDPERRRGYDIQLRCGGSSAMRRAGFADWEAQLSGLQWRAADQRGETWGSRVRAASASGAQTSCCR
ncbi:chaperone protein dnaJ 20, chloroplastic [Brachypodium distachyon]|uniref:J domain-containing protein n=1 Tax=Brachypodium distachyon TaxID=15368 RepID=I1H5Z5_BRADI|nr:chaperone protein dnaJ 20, chloroplastic [Brachypodium distachyon]KQK21897.1 hypothetical protein BRADI_1g63810v3 [Brachypodium distachyon]|eukprot:XP_003558015.1 chaperone protein dnaJ 20, chloroplastic [Brachypodium distachyon]